MTVPEIASTKPATQNENWVVNDVRIFWSSVIVVYSLSIG